MNLEDRAQEHEAKMWELANKPREAAPTYEPGEPGYGPEFCPSCDATMPDLRRRDGRLRCTSCQSALEIVNGRRR